jgi:RHS repeat-associated protein
VEQQSAQAGTTATVYVGNPEQIATTGNSRTTTTYYYANGQRIALAVNGVFSYLASDGLGSTVVALNASGTVTASLLYAPYGGVRYSNGTMPTDYGFTGQRADAATGLDYYNARYYDPAAGQFASADAVRPGGGCDTLSLSRYA